MRYTKVSIVKFDEETLNDCISRAYSDGFDLVDEIVRDDYNDVLLIFKEVIE